MNISQLRKHIDEIKWDDEFSPFYDKAATGNSNRIKKRIMTKINVEFFSERGPRNNNQDYIAYNAEKPIFVICDGMGGHEHGDEASKTVAETIVRIWQSDVMSVCAEVSLALDSCSKQKEAKEMGTTMALASIVEDQLILAHCGDSRIYHIRDRKIIYQSVDHVALTDIGKPIITRAFFADSNRYTPDIYTSDFQSGDIIFMCTDGVYGNGKWSKLRDLLTSKSVNIELIKNIAQEDAFDNYSGILLTIE